MVWDRAQRKTIAATKNAMRRLAKFIELGAGVRHSILAF